VLNNFSRVPIVTIVACCLLAVVCFSYDLTKRRIPDYITLPFLLFGLIWAFFHSGLHGIGESVLGIAAGGLVLLPLHLYKNKRGERMLGGGDVKLMAAAGSLTGWLFILTALMTGSLLALFFAAVAALGGKHRIPYGIALSSGLLLTLALVLFGWL